MSDSPNPKRGNDLGGKEWTRNSISVWDDIRFTKEERKLKHPAMFPSMLVERIIQCFTKSTQLNVLDPFMGSGSTLVAAKQLSRCGIGFEIYEDFVGLAESRLNTPDLFQSLDSRGDEIAAPKHRIITDDAKNIPSHLESDSVDICVTSPPYWDILKQRRSADYKDIRNYGDQNDDLGTIDEYEQFLSELVEVFRGVLAVLKPKSYCVINVMDLRKKSQFFPFHSDLATRLQSIGFILDDIIIWDRRHDYNNLRPLGYPYVFRVNKVHEFLLIMQKRLGS